jgi:hypothetical protein
MDMMQRLLLAGAVLCTSVTVPAVAADGQAATEQAKPAKPRKICRETASSTSRIGVGKVCRTEADWAEIDAKAGAGNGRAVRSLGAADGK